MDKLQEVTKQTKTIELTDGSIALILTPLEAQDKLDLDINLVHYYTKDINSNSHQRTLHVLGKGLMGAVKFHIDDVFKLGAEIYNSMQPSDTTPPVGEVDLVAAIAKGRA